MKKKFHILFLTDNFPPETNAAATRVYERACYWQKWGYDVTVLTCAPNFPYGKIFEGYKNKWYQTEIMNGIKVVRVKTYMAANEGLVLRTFDFMSYMIMAIVSGLWQKKPDVIVATSPQFFAAVGGWLLSLLKRKPFVFELGDIWPASITAVGAMKKNRVIKNLERLELFLYKKSSIIVALTKAFKQNLVARGVQENKIKIIINGVDLPRYSPQEKAISLLEQYELKDKFVIGYIGTHGMAHGLENVLEAAELLSTYDNIKFLFVGNGAARDILIKQAQKKGLRNVEFIPAQQKKDIPAYWSLCDVALIHLKNDPVFSEVIPSKMFESMGMGIPILIAAPEGEATNIVKENKVGLVVEPENPTKLAEIIIELSRNTELLTECKINSYKSANLYSRELQAKKMLEALEQVVAK